MKERQKHECKQTKEKHIFKKMQKKSTQVLSAIECESIWPCEIGVCRQKNTVPITK